MLSLSSRLGDAASGRAAGNSTAQPQSIPLAPQGSGDLQATIAGPIAAAGAAGHIQPGARRSASFAQQVAESLNAGRTGEAESLRSAASLVTTDGGRRTAGDNKGTGPTPGRHARAGNNARPSGETNAAERPEFHRLLRAIRLHAGSRNSSARLQLDPPNLGRIRVDARMTGNELQVEIRTETVEARNLLAQRAGALRAGLEQHGINVERFEVTTGLADDQPPDPGDNSDTDMADHSEARDAPTRFTGAARQADGEEHEVSGGSDIEKDSTVVVDGRLDIKV